MADETQITVKLRSTVDSVSVREDFNVTQDRSNSEFNQGSIEASQTHAQLAITGSITEQYCLVKNVGGSNVVHLQTSGSGSTGRFATLGADGGIAVVPLSAATSLYVVCETGQTTNVTYTILSN